MESFGISAETILQYLITEAWLLGKKQTSKIFWRLKFKYPTDFFFLDKYIYSLKPNFQANCNNFIHFNSFSKECANSLINASVIDCSLSTTVLLADHY